MVAGLFVASPIDHSVSVIFCSACAINHFQQLATDLGITLHCWLDCYHMTEKKIKISRGKERFRASTRFVYQSHNVRFGIPALFHASPFHIAGDIEIMTQREVRTERGSQR